MAADVVTDVATQGTPSATHRRDPATARNLGGPWMAAALRLDCRRPCRWPLTASGSARPGRRALANGATIVSAVTRLSDIPKTGGGSDAVTFAEAPGRRGRLGQQTR